MEIEYKDDRRKGRFVMVAGVILALVAGGIAYYTINRAQVQAGQGSVALVPVVVAMVELPPRQPITAEQVTIRNVPIDATNAVGVVDNAEAVVGRSPVVPILVGQLVTSNLLATSSEGGGAFSILGPDEAVGPDSEAWRAIALTVPDDLALGGLLRPGDPVDVFVTAVVAVSDPTGRYVPDRSTKITYQDIVILARKDAFYVIRAPLEIAEEIAHLQATGAATFSFALRPLEDQRQVDTTDLGETTDRIIERYGLPIPEAVTPGFTSQPPRATPAPTATPSPSASPTASGDPRGRDRPVTGAVRRRLHGGTCVLAVRYQEPMPTPSCSGLCRA